MNELGQPVPETCFFERDPELALSRRMVAEGVGTLLLMLAATGGGLTAQQLFPDSPGLGLVVSAGATAGALVGLILAFGTVSGGHFNPLITGLQWLSGERPLGCTFAYVVSQIGGGMAGALLANMLFAAGGPLMRPPAPTFTLATSELLASAGLMVVVFGCARGGRAETGPFAVGAWLTAAILATPSASYANPAVTLGALFAVGPIALSLSTALVYVPVQVVGALVAFLVIAAAYPRRTFIGRPAAAPATALGSSLP